MTNSDEKLKILQMVQSGKITSEDAIKLLDAIGEDETEVKAEPMTITASAGPKNKKRYLRVRINANDTENGKAKVNVNIPLQLAKKVTGIMKFIPNNVKDDLQKDGIDLDGMDIAGMIEMIENGEMDENLVDIEAGEDGKGATVKVYVD